MNILWIIAQISMFLSLTSLTVAQYDIDESRSKKFATAGIVCFAIFVLLFFVRMNQIINILHGN